MHLKSTDRQGKRRVGRTDGWAASGTWQHASHKNRLRGLIHKLLFNSSNFNGTFCHDRRRRGREGAWTGEGGHNDADTNQSTTRQNEQDKDREGGGGGQSWLVNTTLSDRHKCLLYVCVCGCVRACVCVSLRACVQHNGETERDRRMATTLPVKYSK